MPGPPPKEHRNRRNAPARGEWRASPGFGWQHGPTPRPPIGLKAASRKAWFAWMESWMAAFWIPGDLPQLRHVILLYDQVERGEFRWAGELRLSMNGYGITPAGRQSLRWKPPEESPQPSSRKGARERYGHLHVLDPDHRGS
jgi:hypothetical protein